MRGLVPRDAPRTPANPSTEAADRHSPSGSGVEGDPAARDLYLDLLAEALTGSLAADRWSLVMPPPGRVRGTAWGFVDAVLRDRGLAVVSRADRDAASSGADWPLTGLTMIGRVRLQSLWACVESVLVDGVAGDLLEAGVWRGGAAIFMKGVLAAHGDRTRTVWLADSFQGLPRPDHRFPADRGDRTWAARDLAVPLEEVRDAFARYGLLDERVRFIPGWFADTLPSCPVESLALLRVDADLYGSTMVALRELYGRVVPGGYVIIDDYGARPSCREAVDDFRREQDVHEPLHRVDHTAVLWRRGK